MATDSQVVTALVTGMPADIEAKRAQLKRAQESVHAAFTELFGLATKYADIKTTVEGYAGNDPFVLWAQSLMARNLVDYAVLRDVADAVHIEMDAHPEF